MGTVISESPSVAEQAPPINDTAPADPATTQTTTTPPQLYTVVAANASSINTTHLSRYGTVGTQARANIELTMQPANVTAVEALPWVREVRRAVQSRSPDIPGSSNGTSLGVESLHREGLRGTGATIGIIDTGFETGAQQIAANVVETKSFRNTAGDPAHGTSVAEVVTRTAPDSQLYLVSTETATDDEAAIDYLTAQDVDIIIFAAGYPAVEDTGEHFLTDDITAARDNGTLFIASAGNEAQTHWEGSFRDTDGDSMHEWAADGDEVNSIPDSTTTYSGTVEVYVRWRDGLADSSYLPAFYDPVADEYIRVDRDGVYTTGSNKYTHLSATVINRPVALVIQHGSGLADDEIEVVFGAGPRSIERHSSESSVSAPADVPAATSVAAYEADRQRIAPYSSRGPTDDGRQGVDVTGYTNIAVYNGLYGSEPSVFAGTSAAAPYVGGVAALVEQQTVGDASPEDVERALTTSSDDILTPGPDTISGTGVVNATRAAEAAAPTMTVTDATVSPTTVTANTTVAHELSYTATGASNDGTPDTHTVTLPNTTTIEPDPTVTVTDAAGGAVPLSSNLTVDSSAGGSNNQLTFTIAPDSAVETDTLNVDMTVTASYAIQSSPTTELIYVAVTDSSRGTSNTTATVTVQPPGGFDPVVEYGNEQGAVEVTGLLAAIGDWRNGAIDVDELLEVISSWRG